MEKLYIFKKISMMFYIKKGDLEILCLQNLLDTLTKKNENLVY